MAEGRISQGTDVEMSNIPDLIKREVDSLIQTYSSERSTQRVSHSHPEEYNFTHELRGLAIVISNGEFQSESLRERAYSNKEISMISTAFRSLGFLVLKFQNLSAKQIEDVLQNVSSLVEIHKTSDAFACAIGSHGNEVLAEKVKDTGQTTKKYDHVIYGTDTFIKTADVIRQFDDSRCRGLNGKPRLFFIQACRSRADDSSDRYDHGATTQILENETVNLPHPCDSKEDMNDSLTTEATTYTPDNNIDSIRNEEFHGQENSDNDNFDYVQDHCNDQLEGIGSFLKNCFRKLTLTFSGRDLVSTVTAPCRNHFLIAYATAPGKLALGRDTLGGWLFLGVAKGIELHVMHHRSKSSQRLDLLAMLTQVASAISIQMQSNTGREETTGLKTAVCIEHRLLKDVVF